jgi:hypothetical protein
MSDVPGGPTPPPPPPPPMADGPRGDIPPKRLGEILSAAFDIYKANASQLILIVAIVVVPLSLVGAIFSEVVFAPERIEVMSGEVVVGLDYAGRSWGAFLLVGAIGALIGILISALLQAATVRAAAQASIGDRVDVEASYRYGFRRLWSVILVSLLVGLIVAAGFILLIVPGIIFLVFLSVSIPVLVVEGRRGTDAMGRSWNLVKGQFWHVLGVILVAALIVGIVSGLIGAIGGNAWVARWIFTAIAQIVTAPFAALVSVLLYLDLRARSEALTSETLRGELAAGA